MLNTDLDLWVFRQMNKPRLHGIHLPLLRSHTFSISGWYVYNHGNLETCKRIYRETLQALKLMPSLPQGV